MRSSRALIQARNPTAAIPPYRCMRTTGREHLQTLETYWLKHIHTPLLYASAVLDDRSRLQARVGWSYAPQIHDLSIGSMEGTNDSCLRSPALRYSGTQSSSLSYSFFWTAWILNPGLERSTARLTEPERHSIEYTRAEIGWMSHSMIQGSVKSLASVC